VLLSSVVTVKGSAEVASKRGWWDWQEEALGRAANAEMSQWLVKGMASPVLIPRCRLKTPLEKITCVGNATQKQPRICSKHDLN
jgi:hypothetical protein